MIDCEVVAALVVEAKFSGRTHIGDTVTKGEAGTVARGLAGT